jgi:hypothetical protein
MSKEEILKAIRLCAKKLKRNPTRRDLREMAGISEERLYKLGGLKTALEEAGLRPLGSGFRQQESTVLLDWATVARKAGKIPTVAEYESRGRFSDMPFHSRYGSWVRVPEAFRRFAREQKIQGKWKDVLKMTAALTTRNGQAGGESMPLARPITRRARVLEDRAIYGSPLHLPEMAHAPINELGVIFAFGALARRLGFIVLRCQTGFPDCEAMREVAQGQWQRVRIEFEFESRNFFKHRHDPKGCDLIVCWIHNWKECPEELEVVELRSVLKNRGIGTSLVIG